MVCGMTVGGVCLLLGLAPTPSGQSSRHSGNGVISVRLQTVNVQTLYPQEGAQVADAQAGACFCTPRVSPWLHCKRLVLLVCAHAPHNADAGRDEWWATLQDILRRVAQHAVVVLMGDFNLHLDQAFGDAIGDLVWPHPHPSPPMAFFEILRACSLWIPSTYEYCHPGPTTTWHPPAGVGHARIDYIVIPQAWQVPQAGSFTRCQTSVLCPGLCAGRHSRPASPRLNTAAMRTPDGRQAISEISAGRSHFSRGIWMCIAVPKQLKTTFWKGLQAHFPSTKSPCRREYFDSETWRLRGEREWAWSHLLWPLGGLDARYMRHRLHCLAPCYGLPPLLLRLCRLEGCPGFQLPCPPTPPVFSVRLPPEGTMPWHCLPGSARGLLLHCAPIGYGRPHDGGSHRSSVQGSEPATGGLPRTPAAP